VLTNQRLLGYAHVRFPRERLFLESFPLDTLTTVSLRQKSYEPLFQELLISDGQRRAYIRSSRQRIEQIYHALRANTTRETLGATEELDTDTPGTSATSATSPTASGASQQLAQSPTVYGRQDVRRTFEQSPLGITVLFVGGLLLEIIGVLVWTTTQSAQIGLPLCLAGFVAVIAATVQRRRHHI
jgi:hypothetical protein